MMYLFFLNVTYDVKRTLLPLNTGYNANNEKKGKGEMVEIYDDHKRISVHSECCKKLSEYAEKNDGSLNVGEETYLRLTYYDVFNNLHMDYFYVDHFSFGWKIPDTEGNRLYKIRDNKTLINIESITSERYFDLVKDKLQLN